MEVHQEVAHLVLRKEVHHPAVLQKRVHQEGVLREAHQKVLNVARRFDYLNPAFSKL